MSRVLRVALALLVVLMLAAAGGFVWLSAPDIEYATLATRYAVPGSHFLALPGGIRLHYRDEGNPAGPALVLLHGFGDSAGSWERWVAALGADYHLYSLDLPGHGLTEAPPGWAPGPARYVEVVAAFANAEPPARFALAGNSMGGEVAWRYALRYPQRLTALVLVDSAGWPLRPAGEVPLAFRLLRYRLGRYLLAQIDNRPLIEQALRKEFVDRSALTPQFLDRWAALQRAPGHREILMSFPFSEFGRADEATLARLKAPTLVLQGAVDPLIPVADARRFAETIPDAQLIVYPNVGHLPQLEVASVSAADVAGFLAAHR